MKLLQNDFDELEDADNVDENDPDYTNGGLWNEVIEEVEEEEEEQSIAGSDGDSNQGHFQEFDLEATEKLIRDKSRTFHRETTSVTPSRYFDDDVVDDAEKDRHSWHSQIRPSVSVKNIAKLFETTTQSEVSGIIIKELLNKNNN